MWDLYLQLQLPMEYLHELHPIRNQTEQILGDTNNFQTEILKERCVNWAEQDDSHLLIKGLL